MLPSQQIKMVAYNVNNKKRISLPSLIKPTFCIFLLNVVDAFLEIFKNDYKPILKIKK
jgi:hypothetical protein